MTKNPAMGSKIVLNGSGMDIVAENVDGESQSHSSVHQSMNASATVMVDSSKMSPRIASD